MSTTVSRGVPEGEFNSATIKLVYLYIKHNENVTVSELATRLDMSSLTIIPIVQQLEKSGHVVRDDCVELS